MNFDKLPAPGPAWAPFDKDLTEAISNLEEDQFLVVGVKRTNRYVQFAGQGAQGMRVEAVSNNYLRGKERLSDADIQRMLALGWSAPTGGRSAGNPENDPMGSSNYFIDCTTPDYGITCLTIATIEQVFGVPSPIFLEYEASDTDGNSILLPRLGLRRAVRESSMSMGELADRLLQTLREHCDIPTLDFDEDGEIGVSRGAASVFARPAGQASHVRFIVPLAADIPEDEITLRQLNRWNILYGWLHFKISGGVVIGTCEIPANPFVAQHVIKTLDDLLEAGDELRNAFLLEQGLARSDGAGSSSYKH